MVQYTYGYDLMHFKTYMHSFIKHVPIWGFFWITKLKYIQYELYIFK